MEIEHVQEEHKGAFVAMDGTVRAGEMTYSRAGESKIIIDHTEVNPQYKGQGLGKKMLLKAVYYARAESVKIIPLCPFVKASFEKDESIQDVLN